jgi:chemotaxis protein MotB
MARRKKDSARGPGSGDWLNTYADMVTLLLTFFILLYSMSSLDAAKFNMLVSAFTSDRSSSDQIVIFAQADGSLEDTASQAGPDSTNEEQEITDLEEVYLRLQEIIKESGAEDSVELSKGDGYVFISFMDEMLFQPNSARLKDPSNMEILSQVGYAIRMVEDEVELISVNGHTAAIPDDPNYPVSDRELSSQRADVVLMYLEDNVGVDGTKLLCVAWGKNRPIAENTTAEGMSRNRRVEILISADNPIADQMDNVYEKLMEE